MKAFLFACLFFSAFAIPGATADWLNEKFDRDSTSFLHSSKAEAPSDGGQAKRVTPKGWVRTKATFYGEPYDSNPKKYKTSDGTPYAKDALFCAIWKGNGGQELKLGTRIEVFWLNSGFTSFHTVRDRQKHRSNGKVDFPTGTWLELSGLPRSAGNADIEWRIDR